MSVSKIVFYSTALLILTGAAYLFYSVPDQFIKLRLMEKGISAYFYSTGARSAGFLNIWIPDWENLPKSFISVLMLIGGGPAGTTGGFGILFFALIFRRIFFGNRRTAKNESRLIIGSLTFVLLFLFLITALLLQIDTSWDPLYHPFASKIFDVISAFTNVGWTSHYRWTGFYFNVLLVLSMFIGRIFTIYIGIKTLRYWSDRSSNN
jgi:trk system potassium uptake protein TrkH